MHHINSSTAEAALKLPALFETSCYQLLCYQLLSCSSAAAQAQDGSAIQSALRLSTSAHALLRAHHDCAATTANE